MRLFFTNEKNVAAAVLVLSAHRALAYENHFASGQECDLSNQTEVNVRLNFFAERFGRYEIEGCDGVSPTLILATGVEYTFNQNKISNWFHPLGFAYYPDGALVDATELEPNTVKEGNDDTCVATETCDSPHYYIGDDYLGGPSGDGGFGLDLYEPQFAQPIDRWYGDDRENPPAYNVRLEVNQADTHEAFYFCHIHAGMSGRINFCDKQSDGSCTVRTGTDEDLYDYVAPDSFDETCGTFGVQEYADDADGYCEASNFLCEAPGQSSDNVFQCYDAINCAMASEMRVTYGGVGDRFGTFLRQMIPHHENAVNMAKIMLKQPQCNADGDDEFDDLMRSVINVQNAQIQYMRDHLAGEGKASVDDAQCDPVTGRDTHVRGTPTFSEDDLLRDQVCEILPANASDTYTTVLVTLDYYAFEFGYYRFSTEDGRVTCSGTVPNLVLAADHEYRFVQQDITNWYHPLGFAYYPDGAIVDADELEPGIDPTPNSGDDCAVDESCQSPQYYKGDSFLGGENGDGGFGLDAYEPAFSAPIAEWYEDDQTSIPYYNVRLTVIDPITPEVFYFCHIHGSMSGRISVCDYNSTSGECTTRPDVTEADDGYITDTPVALYEHYVPSEFDQTCGSSGLAAYEPGNGYDNYCQDQIFLCTDADTYDNYAGCYDAMDCHMHHQMKVEYTGNCDELFINSMIPHHQNAVNMAKTTLLYLEQDLLVNCDDLSNCPDYEAADLLRDIIQNQNAQIQYMRDYLGSIPGALEEPELCPDGPTTTTTTRGFSAATKSYTNLFVLLGCLLGFVAYL
jgi:uncharacterized protein (DUF305 family)